MKRGTVVALALAAVVAATATARERQGEASFDAAMRAEEALLQSAETLRVGNLRAQAASATALAKASSQLASALEAASKPQARTADATDDRSVVTVQQALVNAELAVAGAREALERLVVDAARLDALVADRRERVAAYRDSREKLRVSLPPVGPTEGEWRVVFRPSPDELVMRLVQDGPFVSGTLEGRDGGSVSGRFSGGQLHLERFDAAGSKVADLAGAQVSADEISGSWQATVFGTGRPDSGTFTARRSGEPEPSGGDTDGR